MLSLADIAPSEIGDATITVGSKHYAIKSVSGITLARIYRKFPEIAKQMAGVPVPYEDFVLSVVEAVPQLIAAALGSDGDIDLISELEGAVLFSQAPEVFAKILEVSSPPLAEGEAGSENAPNTKVRVTK